MNSFKPKYGELAGPEYIPPVAEPFEPTPQSTTERVDGAVELMRQRYTLLLGRLAVLLEPDLAGPPSIMTMARGGNYKNQRINLQNSGKANAKQPMTPEQKRLRKRKRKKK